MKFDFLGLRNLTILDWAVRYVRQFNADKRDFDVMALELDDAAAYKILCDANTTAVFQLESRGMKELLKKLRPNTFEDIIAMLALYRPGPLESGMVDDFVNRKHGRASVDYFHSDRRAPSRAPMGSLSTEQVMLISQIIGGYSLGGADLLRRAMGKKSPRKWPSTASCSSRAPRKRAMTRTGGQAVRPDGEVRGLRLQQVALGRLCADLVPDRLAQGVSPDRVLAATMSSDMDDTDKVQIFCRDAQDNGVEVLPPDVNHSGYRFEPVADKHTERVSRRAPCATAWARSRARGRARSRKSCGRARKAARFRTCSTSAAVSASIRSTGAPSRR